MSTIRKVRIECWLRRRGREWWLSAQDTRPKAAARKIAWHKSFVETVDKVYEYELRIKKVAITETIISDTIIT